LSTPPGHGYYEELAHRYDSISPGIAGDVAFYRRLALSAKPPVLELGCGTGRVTIPIAHAGVPIVGLDSAAQMLAIARAKAGDVTNPCWLQADMRSFDIAERFGLIIVPYRGFQHLLTEADRELTLARVFKHLRAGGRLALDLINDAAFERLAQGPATAPIRRRPRRGAPRLASLSETAVRKLMDRAGFAVEAVYGGFDGSGFGDSSVNAVWVATKPRRSA